MSNMDDKFQTLVIDSLNRLNQSQINHGKELEQLKKMQPCTTVTPEPKKKAFSLRLLMSGSRPLRLDSQFSLFSTIMIITIILPSVIPIIK